MQSHYITRGNSTIHYRQFGDGPKLIFCFHGYGREGNTFSILERKLGKLYTIVAIDFPFHGLTKWKEDKAFEPKQLMEFLLQIGSNLKNGNSKFILLGFSMGGRIALHLTQLMAERVERLILLAPDGLTFNFWRWLGTDTRIGNKLVAYIIYHPAWIAAILVKLQEWKIIHQGVAGFLAYYLENEEHRLLFYHRYISMRKFRPSVRHVRKLVRKYRIPVRMMYGRFDHIIPLTGGTAFRKGIEEFTTMKIAEAGHNLLNEVQLSQIAQLINE